ncbi:uncharacterized protein LOC143305762 [Osmia lignaria lignaria]|uniref:uncharacterized protein LOC143305762 n=1 Tax=Osmia lignaria lignaria TaxID=1437193 RepID=UPI00402B5547
MRERESLRILLFQSHLTDSFDIFVKRFDQLRKNYRVVRHRSPLSPSPMPSSRRRVVQMKISSTRRRRSIGVVIQKIFRMVDNNAAAEAPRAEVPAEIKKIRKMARREMNKTLRKVRKLTFKRRPPPPAAYPGGKILSE